MVPARTLSNYLSKDSSTLDDIQVGTVVGIVPFLVGLRNPLLSRLSDGTLGLSGRSPDAYLSRRLRALYNVNLTREV